jgi:phosphonate transport system ATP-binding protein
VRAGGSAPLAALESPTHVIVSGLSLERGGRRLFSDLTVSVPRGGFLAVVGPSGAGKSTFLAAMAGLLAPLAGEIRFAGAAGALRAPGALRGRLGLVFQELRLVPTATLLDNVLAGRLGRHAWWSTVARLPRQGESEARALLSALGIAELAGRAACEVSGGEQQRAALARALFLEPEAVLADEPVSALDPDRAVSALQSLCGEARRRRATVICVLHDRSLVERFAEQVLTIDPQLPQGWRVERVREAAAADRLDQRA